MYVKPILRLDILISRGETSGSPDMDQCVIWWRLRVYASNTSWDKYALSQAREETARADAISTSLLHKTITGFWKSIRNMSDKIMPPATSINDITGAKKISEMRSQHYNGILNCVNNLYRKCHVQSLLNFIDSADQLIITPNDIAMAIRGLKRRNSVGFDLLASES